VSFLLDPPLLVAAGIAIERLAPDEDGARTASRATVAAFVGTSVALYLDMPGLGLLWRPFGSKSGRDFMLNSGLTRFRHERPQTRTHLLAALLFCAYPLWLRAGRGLARR
jgi:hypothetical protein